MTTTTTSTTNCGCGCVNVLADAGATVNVCCCDGTGTTNEDGSTTNADGSVNSPNGLIKNAIVTCVDGDLVATWENIDGLTVDVLVDGSTIESDISTGTYTKPANEGEGTLVLQISGTTEQISLDFTACEQPAAINYTLSAVCGPNNDIVLSWNNPNSESLYLYRTDDNTLITQTSSTTTFNDVAPIGASNTYVLSSTGLPALTQLATTSIDFTECHNIACAEPTLVITESFYKNGIMITRNSALYDQLLAGTLDVLLEWKNLPSEPTFFSQEANLLSTIGAPNGGVVIRKDTAGSLVDTYDWIPIGGATWHNGILSQVVRLHAPNAYLSADWPWYVLGNAAVCYE